jgi:hypothetical protein
MLRHKILLIMISFMLLGFSWLPSDKVTSAAQKVKARHPIKREDSELLASAVGGQFSVLSLRPEKRQKLSRFCPKATKMYKSEEGEWKATGGWRSERMSFVNHIYHFVGSQWQGVDLGTIICMYQGEKGTFPIVLHRDNLALRPDGMVSWKLDKSGARFTCAQTDVRKCPFIYRSDVIKHKGRKNVYEDIGKIK